MAKIAIIGAGSAVFARRLITDFLTLPSLQGSQIALMDINHEALKTITAWTEHAIAQAGLPATVQATTDRRVALKDADYVIITIRVGGVNSVLEDFRITGKYGIDHSVGDTMGPGGVFYFLRNGSEIVRIAQEMELLIRSIQQASLLIMNCCTIIFHCGSQEVKNIRYGSTPQASHCMKV